MRCAKCTHYSRQLRRCKLGKINPLTAQASVIPIMGAEYLCAIDEECRKRKEQLCAKAAANFGSH